ncbi:MAG: ester cyclase [Solirubrobacteraceae bacterium]
MSTPETTRNQETFRRFHDAINTGDVEVMSKTIDEVADPDVIVHTPLPVQTTGAETLKQAMALLLRAFPDVHLTIEDLIAEGDKVVGRNAFGGTHRGEYMGVPPTGRSFSIEEIVIFRFSDGRITESWAVVDVFSQMRQLGAVAERFS